MSQPTKKAKTDYRRLSMVTLVILVFVIAADFSVLGGNVRFYAKWVACGTKPVQVSSWSGVAWYEESPALPHMMRNQEWYCTPYDAELKGFSADSHEYSYPHLTEKEASALWP